MSNEKLADMIAPEPMRRRGDRRQTVQPVAVERRKGDRRDTPGLSALIKTLFRGPESGS